MTRTKKAYTVREDYEGHSVVVFASSGAEARRLGGSMLELSGAEGVRLKRRVGRRG